MTTQNPLAVLDALIAERIVMRGETAKANAYNDLTAGLIEARAAVAALVEAAGSVCERGTDSPLWQRLEAALVRFDGAQP